MPNQRDAWESSRIAEPRICIAKTGNVKRPRIGLGEEAYKEKAKTFEPSCNTCRERPGWLLSCAKPPISLQKYI